MSVSLPIKINLAPSFFHEEVRCGFRVDERMKRIWAIELDLLNEFFSVCKQHDIVAHISYGTLLGAVRHQGFIPWDDDADVWMTRHEYRKLRRIATTAFHHPYYFQDYMTDPQCFIPHARLRNSETTAVVRGQDVPNYNNGIYVDINILDGASSSLIGKKTQWFLYRIMINIMGCYYGNFQKDTWLKNVVLRAVRPFVRLLSYQTLGELFESVMTMYEGSQELNPNTYTSRVKGYSISSEEAAETIPLEFENLLLPGPKNYDAILTKIFGNYREFPPESERRRDAGMISFDPDVPYYKKWQRIAV